jgi:glycyl-tRNA synthetase
VPVVIEPSGGVESALLAFLVDSYREEQVNGKLRVVLGLHKELSPVKAAVLPLLKNRPEIVELAKKIAKDLSRKITVRYDDTAAIGKLYRRQDEIGTLYCITVDVESLDDRQVTVRERDSMRQERIAIDRAEEYLLTKLDN